MATVKEYTNQKAEELFARGLPKEEVDRIIDEDLLFRGLPLKDLQEKKITSEQFLSQEVTPTVREHVNNLHSQGLSDDEIDLDMVNRGFYDLDRNMRDNLDQLLPDKLETDDHKKVMEGGKFLGLTYRLPWAERYKTGGFEGHDPWELEPLKKNRTRLEYIRQGVDRTETDEVMEYLAFMEKRNTAIRDAAPMGMTVGAIKAAESFSEPPDVSAEAKERAEKIMEFKGEMGRLTSAGGWVGLGTSAAVLVDELLTGGALTPDSLKDDDQTRYFRMPVVGKDGRIKKNAAGKDVYRLIESPEEALKLNQEGLYKEARDMFDRLILMRNTANLGLTGKAREEVYDLAKGVSQIAKVLLPLLSSPDASAVALMEKIESDPNYSIEDARFEALLQGFQTGKNLPPAFLSYLGPLLNSAGVAVGRSGVENLEDFERQRAQLGPVVLPWTQQLADQATSMPIDTMFWMLPVTKLLKGLGSRAAANANTKMVASLRAAGIPEEEVAKAQAVDLLNRYSESQKSMMRRIFESKVGREADDRLVKVVGSGLDALTTSAKMGGAGLLFMDAGGALNEAAALAGVGAVSGTVSQVIKNVPRVRRALTPEIYASNNPYIESVGREASDLVADAQNLIDSWALRTGYQAQRGDIPGDRGLQVDITQLPAYMQDNVARITAKVDLDPEVVNARALLEQMDPEGEGYAAAKADIEDLRRDKFIDLAEESGLVFTEEGMHSNLTRINRDRAEVQRQYESDVADATNAGRIALADEALVLGQDASTARALDEMPGQLEQLDFDLAEAKVDFELGSAQARSVRSEAISDVHLGTAKRVERAEARLKKAKENYAKARANAKKAEEKLKATGETRKGKAKRERTKSRIDTQTYLKVQRARDRAAKIEQRLKAEVQRLTEAKIAADKKISAKTTVAQRLMDIDRKYNARLKRLSQDYTKQVSTLTNRKLQLEARQHVLEARRAAEVADVENARLFAEGKISLDDLVASRNADYSSRALARQADSTVKGIERLTRARDRALAKLDGDEADVLNAMKHEYEVTINYKDGVPIGYPLVKKRRSHVILGEDNAFESVAPKHVRNSSRQKQNAAATITLEDPTSFAGTAAQQISNMPLAQQLVSVEAIEKAAVALTENIQGLFSGSIGSIFRGGGKNAAYRWIYESLSKVVFDQYSPKLLRSPSMRDQFKSFLSEKLSAQYKVPDSPGLQLNIERLVNDFASPRTSGQNLFVEIGYTFYKKSGDKILPIATIEDLFTEFATTKIKKKELRRMALEAIQSELPVLQLRVGTNVIVDTMLRRSGTKLDDFKRGVYLSDGSVNWPYVESFVRNFDETGSLPVTFRTGGNIDVPIRGDIDMPGTRVEKMTKLEKALFMDRYQDVLDILGPEKMAAFEDAVRGQLKTQDPDAPRMWRKITENDNFMRLDDFKGIGEGPLSDTLKGLKTQHPALAAEQVRSSTSAFANSKNTDIYVHTDFGDTVGWILKTNDIYQKGWFTSGMRALTALLKLAKTALNPVNHLTNATSNYITLMASEAIDPITAATIVTKSASDMLTYIYNPSALTPEARVQMNALMETGGINQTILVQEVEMVLSQIDAQGGLDSRGIGMITAAYTGRYPSGQLLGHTIKGVKGKVARAVPRLAAAYTDSMKKGYRLFGDELFKFTKARLDMHVNATQIDSLPNGQGMSFMDLSRGNFGKQPFLGHVSKTPDGDFIVVHPDMTTTRGVSEVLKLNAKASMQSANAYYFNLADMGTAFKKLVQLEGIAMSSFWSWRIHSMDIPGLKKGLFYRTMVNDNYKATSSARLSDDLALAEYRAAERRSLLMLAFKDREIDTYDIRRSLPSYLQTAFIYNDLSMILADNQIPFSGFIGYLNSVTKLASLVDPARRDESLFWEKVFPEKTPKAALADLLLQPQIFETAATILGRNRLTKEKFKSDTEWLGAVIKEVGDGRVGVPAKMLKVYLEQQGAVTMKEISGMDKKLVEKRRLYDQQSKSVAMMNSLLMKRYMYLNPIAMTKVIARFPKSYISNFYKRIEKEYAIDINDSDLTQNTFDFLVGRGVNEANAKLIEDELNDLRSLFGGAADNPKIKEGDNTKLGGSFVPITTRLFENMALAMPREGRKKFRDAVKKTIAESMEATADNDPTEIEIFNSRKR